MIEVLAVTKTNVICVFGILLSEDAGDGKKCCRTEHLFVLWES